MTKSEIVSSLHGYLAALEEPKTLKQENNAQADIVALLHEIGLIAGPEAIEETSDDEILASLQRMGVTAPDAK